MYVCMYLLHNFYFIPLQHVREPLVNLLYVFGIVANILCVIVLTRPQMWKPWNSLLASLAVTDITGLTAALIQFSITSNTPCHNSVSYYSWYTFKMLYDTACIIMNPWLVASMAVCRYMIISQRTNKSFLRMNHVVCIVLTTFVLAVVLIIFDFDSADHLDFIHPVTKEVCKRFGVGENFTEYTWYNFVRSFIPCLTLITFTCLIICELINFKQRRGSLFESDRRGESQIRVTTIALLGTLVSSIVCTLVLLVMGVGLLAGGQVFGYFYTSLALAQEVLVAVNSGINIVFYLINAQFVKTLKELFCGSSPLRRTSVSFSMSTASETFETRDKASV